MSVVAELFVDKQTDQNTRCLPDRESGDIDESVEAVPEQIANLDRKVLRNKVTPVG